TPGMDPTECFAAGERGAGVAGRGPLRFTLAVSSRRQNGLSLGAAPSAGTTQSGESAGGRFSYCGALVAVAQPVSRRARAASYEVGRVGGGAGDRLAAGRGA